MSKQPEALRLADALSAAIKQVDADDDVIHVARWFVEDAAAELRRLAAEHEEDQSVIAVWRGRTQRAEAQRDALLEVVQKYIAWSEAENDPKGTTFWERVEMCREVDELARAAIKAVEEGK